MANLYNEQEKGEILSKLAKDFLIEFSYCTNPKYQINWHHNIIAQALEKALKNTLAKKKTRIIIEVPPRHGKSQLATINFPAWVLGKYPDLNFIISSYSGELAQDFGFKTRDLMVDSNYQAIFNTRLRADSKAKSKWLTQEGGGYTAVGAGGAITGRGFDIGIIDDPVKNREEAESEVYREKIWNWYTSTFYTRQDGMGAIVVIMTRWHIDDLVGRLLRKQEEDIASGRENFDTWEVIRFPAIAEEDEKFRKIDEPLWPERFSLDDLFNIQSTVGIYDWESLYQQAPISIATQEFKENWFKKRTQAEIDTLDTKNFLTIDTAISKKAEADYTGFCDNSVDSENKWNLKAWRVKINPLELIDTLFTLHENRRYQWIGIEEGIYLMTLKPFLDEEMRKRNKFLPIKVLKHRQTQKELRIRGLIPRYQSGSIFHIIGNCVDLEKEALTFPKGIHDDTLDATAYQLQIATAPPKRTYMSKEDRAFAKMLKKKKTKSGEGYNLKMT